MKFVAYPAIALSLALVGASGAARAQSQKLFFEGDLVRHALEGQQGPFCVLSNLYKRKEAVAWRIRVLDGASSEQADDKSLKAVTVVLGNGQRLPAKFGGHGRPPTDFFWSLFWTIPADFPTGSLGYKVVATRMDGSEQTWEPFKRDSTQLTVVAGDPVMAPPKQP